MLMNCPRNKKKNPTQHYNADMNCRRNNLMGIIDIEMMFNGSEA